ncbi:hypothetical protein [Nocardioides sp.]|uniref:hypothetical protein n=1 Tax=Nocardioides sp. TaxID=35761 RepID=UPI0027373541|nr:hypothetical protein [Nocardioides sp.]MDP3892329.1 hypothetical protein [Nocardioides sp.]
MSGDRTKTAIAGIRRSLPTGLRMLAVLLMAGLAWWCIGQLGWVLRGFETPGGWVPGSAGAAEHTLLLVPLMTSQLALLVTGSLVGGVCGGLAVVLGGGRRWLTVVSSGLGVAVAVTVVLVQATSAIRARPGAGFAADDRVLIGLCAVVAVASLIGWLFGAAVVLGRPAWGLALGVLAGAAPAWVSGVALPVVGLDPRTVEVVAQVGRSVGSVLLIAALLAVGSRPLSRVALWLVVVLLAWFVGPTLTAAGYLEQLLRPAAGLPHALRSTVEAAWQVFAQASSPGNRPLSGWLYALLAAAALSLLLRVRDRGASTGQTSEPTDRSTTSSEG